MALNYQNFGMFSVTTNNPTVVLTNGSVDGSPRWYSYQSATDTLATIEGAGYFNDLWSNFVSNDVIYVNASNGIRLYSVVSSSSSGVVISAFNLGGPVGTSDITDANVTAAKFAAGAVNTAALAAGAAGVASADVATNIIQSVNYTVSSVTGMYATPESVIAAPGAGLGILIHSVEANLIFSTTAYAAGGSVYLQYGNTAHGTKYASGLMAPSSFMTASASAIQNTICGLSGRPASDVVNTAIYVTNDTAAFTTGNGTLKLNVSYSVVPIG